MFTLLVLVLCPVMLISHGTAIFAFSSAGLRHYYVQRGFWRVTGRFVLWSIMSGLLAFTLFFILPVRFIHGMGVPYVLMFISTAIVVFFFSSPYRASLGSKTLVWLGIFRASLCGLIVFTLLAIALNYGFLHTFSWQRNRVFTENFTSPDISKLRDMEGEESNVFDYTAWLAFDYDGELMMRNPQSYKKVPCREANIDAKKKHFSADYIKFYASLLKCEEGQKPYTDSDGKLYYYHTYVIIDPLMHHAEIEIKE